MLKTVFSRFTPIKNFDSIVKLRKQTIKFFRFDTPTGFTKDEFVHSAKQFKAEIPEIYY